MYFGVCHLAKQFYLDNSATTMPCKRTIDNINYALNNNWGNPSSLHIMGVNAEMELNDARRVIANSINANIDEIFFTSGGTESNNIAIFGAVNSRKKRGNRIVTTTIEHPSVLEPIKSLENQGFEVVYLRPDKNGVINETDIYNAVNDKTILVSIMLVNNEIGSIQPISAAAKIIKQIAPRGKKLHFGIRKTLKTNKSIPKLAIAACFFN